MGKLHLLPHTTGITLWITIKHKETKNIKVALDTGATYVMIPWRTAKYIGLNQVKYVNKIKINTPSGSEIVPLVKTKKIKALNKTVQNVPVIIHDIPPESRIDGLLGLSFLRNFKLTLDFPKGILTLE